MKQFAVDPVPTPENAAVGHVFDCSARYRLLELVLSH